MNHYYEVLGPWGVWSLDQPEMRWKDFLVTEAVWEYRIGNKSSHISGYTIGDRATASPMSVYFPISYLLCLALSKSHWVVLFGSKEHFPLKIVAYCAFHRAANKYYKFKARKNKPCASRAEKGVRVRWPWVSDIFIFVNVQNITPCLQAIGIYEKGLSF